MSENRWISELHWRRESQQSRSEKTQSKLLDATEVLIVEKGTDETSIAQIAKQAGCSVGTVYHHFKDKRALFFALFHRMTETYAQMTEKAADPKMWDGASIRDIISGYIDFMFNMSKEAAAAKAAVALVVADYPELRTHVAELQSEGRKAMVGLMMARRHEMSCVDPAQAATFFIDQLGAMLQARFDPMQRQARVADISDDAFRDQVMILAATFLGLPHEA
jgi:AcrR family transcriptional regulator